jgi:transcription antitermination factor NusG
MSVCSAQDAMETWWAVQVWAGRESSSSTALRLRGYEVFLPTYRVTRRWSDRMKATDHALFPGYVFCRLREHAAAAIVTAPGVIGIVGDGARPLPISDAEIESIRRIVDSHLHVEPCALPQVGQRVQIEVGPLRGAQGIVQTIKNKHRLVASIQLLQRAVAVEIDPAWVSISNEELFDAIRLRHAGVGATRAEPSSMRPQS